MSRRAVSDRHSLEALARQTTFLDYDGLAVDPPPEDSPIKHARRRSSRKAANAANTPAKVTPTPPKPPCDEWAKLNERLCGIEALLREVHERVIQGSIVKEYYTTQDVAKILSKRPYTVREWCRLGRVHGEKSHAGRGLDEEWRISHAELTRIQNEGLLPLQKFSDVERPRRLK